MKSTTAKKTTITDKVTADALRKRYALHKAYESGNIALDSEFDYTTRRSGLPEHISENIVKFVLLNFLGILSTWGCKIGDLTSEIVGIIECKSFTSDGPTSFGPKQKWHQIYFLDARNWLSDDLIVYQVTVANTDSLWADMPVSKTQTKKDQSDENRRPRLNWNALQPYLGEHCKEVYRGTFEGIFTPPTVAPVVLQ